jgi:hypothetical protein
MMAPTTLKKSKISSGTKGSKTIKRKTPKTASLASLNQSVQSAMLPKTLEKSRLPPLKASLKTLKIAKVPPYAMSSKTLQPAKVRATQATPQPSKPIRVILVNKPGFQEFPKRANVVSRKRKKDLDRNDDEDDNDKDYEPSEDEEPDSPIRRTRSEQLDLSAPLLPPTRHHRPKLYPALTPWLDDWNVRKLNDLYPEDRFKWDSSDVPDFDLGEPLDEMNFWEDTWIAENEEKKRIRGEKQTKCRKQRCYGGLKDAERKRAYKKRGGVAMKRENEKFMK